MNIFKRIFAWSMTVGLLFSSMAIPAFAQTQDSVSGFAGIPDFNFTFNATSGPSGEKAGGTIYMEAFIGNFNIDVTCLNVVGNKASIGGVITSSTNTLLPAGKPILFTVQDNNGTGPDMINYPTIPATTLTTCPAPDALVQQVTSGDITVVDAQPATVSSLITSVQNLNLDNGTENSLVTKLNAADKATPPANCDQLSAFINEVNAQSGKKLTSSQASNLVQQAKDVMSNAGCQQM